MTRILSTAMTVAAALWTALGAYAAEPEFPADDFSDMFGQAMQEARLDRADSILTEWQSSNGADPDLYAAQFSIRMVKALMDHSRCEADSAMAFIDRGIDEYPGRLDFRLDKAAAQIETGDDDAALITIGSLLDYGRQHSYDWTTESPIQSEAEGEEATFYGVLDLAAMMLEQDDEDSRQYGAVALCLLADAMPRYSDRIGSLVGDEGFYRAQ